MRTANQSLRQGERLKKERTFIYLGLIHVAVWQKPIQYNKAIIFHLKINFKQKLTSVFENSTVFKELNRNPCCIIMLCLFLKILLPPPWCEIQRKCKLGMHLNLLVSKDVEIFILYGLCFCSHSCLKEQLWFPMYCCCLVPKLCLTFSDPMYCSTPGFPVLHHLPEFAHADTQFWSFLELPVSEAISPFHPLLPSSPFALSLSQHQDLFQWVSSLHQVAKVLEVQLQQHSFQWLFRVDLL